MKKRYVVAGILAAAGLICGGIAITNIIRMPMQGQDMKK